MLYPKPIQKGDTIGLIAPSSPVSNERLKLCMNAVSTLGYRPVPGKSCLESLHGYLSGSDKLRADDINNMFENPNIKAVFCLRGGYGSTRILPLLDYSLIRQNKKIFMGYSDITSFHLAFYSCCHMITFHGPMVSSNMIDNFDDYTKESFEHAVRFMPDSLFSNPKDIPLQTIVPGYARGRILGGCLSLLTSAIGTFYQPDFRNTILFLEEIGETIPRCDRMMQHLKNACILEQINGVILGNFKDCTNPNDPDFTIYDFFHEFFKDYRKPVIWGFQSGHDKPMATVPLGTVCTMYTEKKLIRFEFR